MTILCKATVQMMNEDISVYCRKLRLSRNFVNNAVVEKSSTRNTFWRY